MEWGLERNKTAPCLRSTQELQEMDIHQGFWWWETVRLRKPWFAGSKKWLHQCWLQVKMLTVNNCVLKLVLSFPPCRWHSLELRQWDGINGANEVRNEWSEVSKSLKQEHNMFKGIRVNKVFQECPRYSIWVCRLVSCSRMLDLGERRKLRIASFQNDQ